MPVKYQNYDTKFVLKEKRKISRWINGVVGSHQKNLGNVTYIFCSSEYILELNQKYLNHTHFTDIITFDYCHGTTIEGDIFISVDTVLENSQRFNTSFSDELLRVIIHGILHLLGFSDKTREQQRQMRVLESNALAIFYGYAD